MGGHSDVLLAGPDESVTATLATRIATDAESLTVEAVGTEREAMEAIESQVPDCVVATQRLESGTGLALLEAVRSRWPALPTILVVTDGSEELANEGIAADVTAALHVESLPEAGPEIASQIERAIADRPTTRPDTDSRPGYRHLFEAMNEGMAVHKLLTDADDDPVDYRILRVIPPFRSSSRRPRTWDRFELQTKGRQSRKWNARC